MDKKALSVDLIVKQKVLFSQLTPRQKEVAFLITQGMNNKQIADEMCLKVGTVKNYVSVILEKYKISNRTQLPILINQTDLKHRKDIHDAV